MENYKIIKAPNQLPTNSAIRIFMAGSIDNGATHDWYGDVIQIFSDMGLLSDTLPIHFLVPRRDNWDSNMKPTIDNPLFREQVGWELAAMDLSDIVLFNFVPGSLSPVTMLECGLMVHPSKANKAFVCCADGFWRQGNVEFTCEYYGIPTFRDIHSMVRAIQNRIYLLRNGEK